MIKQKHQQLYDILSHELCSGRWPKGTRLPSVRELAAEYSVSVNVASKAVEMLKTEKLVEVKVGDGIFSLVSGQLSGPGPRYSGSRIFGYYDTAKQLRVLVEDTAPKQLNFWNRFFESVSSRYQDIEIEITYGATENRGFDLVLGSLSFQLQHGFDPEHTLNDGLRKQFHPEFYADSVLTPENCRMGRSRNYFPYGFITKHLRSNRPLPPPEEGECVLEYIARLAAGKRRSSAGYGINSALDLLTNSGVLFCNPEDVSFRMPDPELLRDAFEKTARLFRGGHLIWVHGQYYDRRSADIAETFFNSQWRDEPDPRPEYPYPQGKTIQLLPFYCAVSSATLFPEECLRVLGTLLLPEYQKKAEKERIFQAVKEVSADSMIRRFANRLPPVMVNSHLAGLYPVLQYFVPWELYHFITGRCDFNPLRLESKIRWYLDRKRFPDSEPGSGGF